MKGLHARGRLLLLATLLAFVWALPVAAQRGARVLHRNLAELTADAETIVAGRITRVFAEPHHQFNNISTVVVSLDVDDVLKGSTPREFTFRQFVQDPRDTRDRLGFKLGQHVLLFMTQPSAYGLSSPAGLDQGRFLIVQDAQGQPAVVNAFQNFGLFRNVNRTAPKLNERVGERAARILQDQRGGPIPYAEFREMVRAVMAP